MDSSLLHASRHGNGLVGQVQVVPPVGYLTFGVYAHTSHSSIHTDFDVRGENEGSKNHLDGVIGGAGPTLELTSSNGSIRLLKM